MLDTFDKRMLGDRRVLDDDVKKIVREVASKAAQAAGEAALRGEI